LAPLVRGTSAGPPTRAWQPAGPTNIPEHALILRLTKDQARYSAHRPPDDRAELGRCQQCQRHRWLEIQLPLGSLFFCWEGRTSSTASRSGKVPIGLVSNNWGGTRVEQWTPPETTEFGAGPPYQARSAKRRDAQGRRGLTSRAGPGEPGRAGRKRSCRRRNSCHKSRGFLDRQYGLPPPLPPNPPHTPSPSLIAMHQQDVGAPCLLLTA
jgi:hypothetical protein